ncbi:unnamed protein product [Amoebophrya sp. A25]|nr:unnamed protein product [Amoebophrya sp. A25]|eukprot:GSA25T00022694001.1
MEKGQVLLLNFESQATTVSFALRPAPEGHEFHPLVRDLKSLFYVEVSITTEREKAKRRLFNKKM